MPVLDVRKTNWAADDVVPETDMNRIESNIDYLATPNTAIINSAPGSSMSATSLTAIGSTANMTTYTGRILLVGHLIMSNTAAAADYSVTIFCNGTNVVASSYLCREVVPATAGFKTFVLVFLLTGQTPGASLTFDVRYIKNSGTAGTCTNVRLEAIDI